MRYKATVGERDFEVLVDRDGAVTVDGVSCSVDLRTIDGHTLFSLILDTRSYELHVERREGLYTVMIEGDRFAVDVGQARLKELIAMSRRKHEDATGATIEAPMPGLVVKVLIEPGQRVVADQGLIILEAMKMENEIRSPMAGIVQSISVNDGATVNQGDMLIIIDATVEEEVDEVTE